MLAVLLLLATTVRITHPFEVVATPETAAAWTTFANLAAPPRGTIALLPDEPLPTGAVRLDVLERRSDGAWRVVTTSSYDAGASLVPSDHRRGVLIRTPGDPRYWWGEVPAGSQRAARLTAYRTLTVTGVAPEEVVTLYVGAEDFPQTIGRRAALVPAVPGLACTTASAGSRCTALEPTTTVLTFPAAPAETRVLRVPWRDAETCVVRRKGTVAIRPVVLPSSVIVGGPWRAIALTGGTWSDAAVDCTGEAFAQQRFYGAALVPPPSFTAAMPASERGVRIRPMIGPEKAPLRDIEAMLIVSDPEHLDVPLATATADAAGQFVLEDLGSGTYAFQLLSSLTTSERVRAAVTATVPLDLTFARARVARGRVIRTVGGSATEPVLVHISPELLFREALQRDVIALTRFTTADETGRFAVAIVEPGPYVLEVLWGTARATRRIVVRETADDVDLGDIYLSDGSVLRGSVTGCGGGEAVAILAPDLSKPLTIGMNQLRRAPISAEGHFVVSGLHPGRWSMLFVCNEASLAGIPNIFSIPESGDTVIDFAIDAASRP